MQKTSHDRFLSIAMRITIQVPAMPPRRFSTLVSAIFPEPLSVMRSRHERPLRAACQKSAMSSTMIATTDSVTRLTLAAAMLSIMLRLQHHAHLRDLGVIGAHLVPQVVRAFVGIDVEGDELGARHVALGQRDAQERELLGVV